MSKGRRRGQEEQEPSGSTRLQSGFWSFPGAARLVYQLYCPCCLSLLNSAPHLPLPSVSRLIFLLGRREPRSVTYLAAMSLSKLPAYPPALSSGCKSPLLPFWGKKVIQNFWPVSPTGETHRGEGIWSRGQLTEGRVQAGWQEASPK